MGNNEGHQITVQNSNQIHSLGQGYQRSKLKFRGEFTGADIFKEEELKS